MFICFLFLFQPAFVSMFCDIFMLFYYIICLTVNIIVFFLHVLFYPNFNRTLLPKATMIETCVYETVAYTSSYNHWHSAVLYFILVIWVFYY